MTIQNIRNRARLPENTQANDELPKGPQATQIQTTKNYHK